jgi:hypothetical protein
MTTDRTPTVTEHLPAVVVHQTPSPHPVEDSIGDRDRCECSGSEPTVEEGARTSR